MAAKKKQKKKEVAQSKKKSKKTSSSGSSKKTKKKSDKKVKKTATKSVKPKKNSKTSLKKVAKKKTAKPSDNKKAKTSVKTERKGRNISKSSKSKSEKKSSKSNQPKRYVKVKLTKADAAKKNTKNKKNTPVKQEKNKATSGFKKETTKNTISSKKTIESKTEKKQKSPKIPSSSTQSIQPAKSNDLSQGTQDQSKEITLEKVLEETKEQEFVPQPIRTVEKTGFSDQLSDDLSSVYAHTSEDLPEPPGKYTIEYVCKTPPDLLYKFLTDPVELSEWFCDSVNIRNGIYTFVWNGVPQHARLVKQERNKLVRFQWADKNDGSYFEFVINKNPLTGDVILSVTDFSEENELESNKLWWNSQINKLKNILGLQ